MNETGKYEILSKINYPEDVRQLDISQLKQLCTDIREYLVDTIAEVGGHFGGGLGTVELTVAVHKVFNTPYDLVVWDTGHQAYPHKILTGRKDALKSIRQLNGISGFLKDQKVNMMLLVQGTLQLQFPRRLVWPWQEI